MRAEGEVRGLKVQAQLALVQILSVQEGVCVCACMRAGERGAVELQKNFRLRNAEERSLQ